jgi:hypothetical protein
MRGGSDDTSEVPSRKGYGEVSIYLLGAWAALLFLVPPALQRVPIWLACVAAMLSLVMASWATIRARSIGSRLVVLVLVVVVVLLNAANFVAAQVVIRP